MTEANWTRKTPPPGRARMLAEGMAAGLAFAVADALAAGPWRTPISIVALIFATAIAGGLLVGLIAPRIRGLAAGVTLLGAAAVNGLSTWSKELGSLDETARSICLGVSLGAALLAGIFAGTAQARSRSRGTLLLAFAGVPGGTLLLGALELDLPLAFGAGALLAPLLAVLAWRVREQNAVTMGLAIVALSALTMPVLREGDANARRASSLPSTSSVTAPAKAPNVVLLVVDTLRADAIDDLLRLPADRSAVGRLVQDGVRFEQAVSAAPWTLPSMASLFTGLYPSQHGAVSSRRPLPTDVPTLAERFHAAGYETAAFTGGGFVGSAFGIDRGFERFDATADYRFRPFRSYTPLVWRVAKNRYAPQRWLLRRVREFGGATEVRERVTDWIEHRDTRRPYFLVAHTYQVHDYYVYDPPTDDRVRGRRAAPEVLGERLTVHPSELETADQATIDWFEELYDVRVRHVDRELARLLAAIDENAGDRPRVIALTSDHGEGFDAGAHRVHHGGRLHDDLLRVPLLLVAPPFDAGTDVDETVRTVDLMPTLLELCGITPPDGLAGRSLVGPLTGTADFPAVAFGEEFPAQRAARTRDWKLIGGAGGEEAYDLASDPAESSPTADGLPDALRQAWSAFPDRYPARVVDEAEIDAETRAQLRALGYADED